jgi:cytochrome c5
VVAAAGRAIGLGEAHGQRSDRSGKEVLEAVRASCLGTGKNGAPRSGEEKAWSPRAAQELTALMQHAIQGIRQMPSRGGNPGVPDFEIERAITYMVNQSGGHWAQPINKATLPAVRSGAQVVHMQCAKSIRLAKEARPRSGTRPPGFRVSRKASMLRFALRFGSTAACRRGGLADLTDREVRSAVIHMFNPVSIATAPAPEAPAVVRDGMHEVVGGMDVYLGIISAGSIRMQRQAGFETQQMHGGIPRGKDYYHLSVSLLDSKTSAEITNANVEVTVEDPVMGGETKTLDTMVFNDAISYGKYYRMPGRDPYKITVHITKPGAAHPVSAEFDFKHY